MRKRGSKEISGELLHKKCEFHTPSPSGLKSITPFAQKGQNRAQNRKMDAMWLKKGGCIGYAYAVNDLRKVLAQVERITLSLKSIYRLLLNDDFPV